MTTSNKLWLGFGVLTALLVAFSVTIIIRVWSIEGLVREQADVARPRSELARQLEINVLGYVLGIRAYLQSGDATAAQEAAQDAADVERHLKEYEQLATTARQREMAAKTAS